ncbi:hypothetical protein ACFU98_29760 [Streptomyces sp. NPDC057575]|uniref:hypothetical protein n=1 Tax=unclassified Streptomyces TaxID=2593676 RepID=UPI0036ADFA6F
MTTHLPSPYACRWCETDRQPAACRGHLWAPPTQKQILARMRARRANRTAKES